jgi:hypothetical protein
MNVQKLYPQFTQLEDKPVVNIRPIKYREYEARLNGEPIEQKQKLIQKEGNFV